MRTRNDEETAAADENSRIFAFFLDDYHVMRDSSMSMKKPVIDFIANQLAPSDLATVMYPLTPVDAAVLTRNHQGIINTVEKFEGRKYNYEPINGVEQGYVYKLTPDAIEMIRRQVTLSAIRGICTKLGSLREGRKSLILISEGFNATLPPQMRSNMAGGFVGSASTLGADPFAGDETTPWRIARSFPRTMDMQREMQDVWDACNRNNTAIYAVDPRGLAVGGFDITANISMRTSQNYLNASIDTLRELADNTDGRAIVNRNDLAAAMKQIIRDASAYYLVGYNSTQAPTDGKFHEIKVRVKRPGVQVRARKGYWAYTAEDAKRAIAGPRPGPPAEVTKALAALAPMTNRRYIRTWIGNDKGEDGQTRVTLLWEPLPPTPGVRRDEPRRVTVLATSAVRRHRLSRPRAHGAGRARQRRHHRFSAPPGKLDLRLTIEGDGTGTLDTEDRDARVAGLVGTGSDAEHAEDLVRAQRARVHRADVRAAARADRGPRVPPHRSAADSFRRLRAGRRADDRHRAAPESAGHEDDGRSGHRARRRQPDAFDRFPAGEPRARAVSARDHRKSRRPQTRHRARGLSAGILTISDLDQWISDHLSIDIDPRSARSEIELFLRVHPPQLRDRRDAIDRDDVGGDAHVDTCTSARLRARR